MRKNLLTVILMETLVFCCCPAAVCRAEQASAQSGIQVTADESARAGIALDGKVSADTATDTETEKEASASGMEPATPSVNGTPHVESTELAAPSVNGALHVEGTQLVDEKGQAVQLCGISTHGIAWYPDYINESCFRQFREKWNVNVMRLAMYTEEYGGYCSGGDQACLKELVEKGVRCAADSDMYVIVDWHVLSDLDPNVHKEEAKAFFAEMSEKFSGYDNVLYEICNEPNGGTEWSAIKAYAEEVIPVIRANDADAVILVGTPNWSQYVGDAAADPIISDSNVMYTLHYYAATHKAELRTAMTDAVESGLPIFVSEYGICDASGNGALDIEEADRWIETMDRYHISYVMWNLSNKNESSSILSPACQKTSDFTRDDFTNCGKWLYEMLTGDTEGSGSGDAIGGSGDENGGRGNENSGSGDENGGSGDDDRGEKDGADVFISGQMKCTVSLKNSWESNGEYFFQYDLILENTGGACSQWAVDMAFTSAFELSDSWNGSYTAAENTLHIESLDYNGRVEEGGYVTDIGFIVRGQADLAISGE